MLNAGLLDAGWRMNYELRIVNCQIVKCEILLSVVSQTAPLLIHFVHALVSSDLCDQQHYTLHTENYCQYLHVHMAIEPAMLYM